MSFTAKMPGSSSRRKKEIECFQAICTDDSQLRVGLRPRSIVSLKFIKVQCTGYTYPAPHLAQQHSTLEALLAHVTTTWLAGNHGPCHHIVTHSTGLEKKNKIQSVLSAACTPLGTFAKSEDSDSDLGKLKKRAHHLHQNPYFLPHLWHSFDVCPMLFCVVTHYSLIVTWPSEMNYENFRIQCSAVEHLPYISVLWVPFPETQRK